MKNNGNQMADPSSTSRFWVTGALFGVVLFLGVISGLVLAMLSVERTVLVDCRTGELREEISVGPVCIHDAENRLTVFAVLPALDKSLVSTENDFQVAYKFGAWSKVSPNTEGGHVLAAMNDLASVLRFVGMHKASEIKTEYLRKLDESNPVEAAALMRKRAGEAMDAAMEAGK